ncbi:hypothetical protein KEG38_21040 [Polyangium jinanense]|uniref:hypothetical protein n=1 Tax=Polyangium jinanense TaxID=2829994 RepID=UPI00233FB471|nr:hypothetical protein [Polyangium jinanense]MDC3952215.1 hypothetical protein [Polyangium jinanense]MDC3956360.1 hypothetical protein [Polyangium jinanense]
MVTRTFVKTLAVFTAVALSLAARDAEAQKAEDIPPGETPKPTTPRVHHAPIASAEPGTKLVLEASFEHAELIRNVLAVYQTSLGEMKAVPFQRGGERGYIAVIPGEALKAPGIGYTIEVEQTNGTRFSAFASRQKLHPVSVIEDRTDAKERAALSRLGGRRSVVGVAGEYVGFGTTTGTIPIPCAAGQATCQPGEEVVPSVDEQYYRVEASYTYRPLRTVSEFGFRLGLVRGWSLVPLSEYNEERYKVGLNFGAARIRFRVLDLWHLETELQTSVTEIGFSVGLGASTLIGDPYGSKLILGFESLGLGDSAPFGNRFYSRLDLVAGDRVLVSPIVEVTDMPNAETYGVRLIGEVGIALGRGFSVQLRGGYQARRSTSGGPGFGGSVLYAF